jgi:uncharacterized protein YqgQ
MIYYGKTLSSSGPKLTAVQEELNDLFKKGLITQKDYDSKKAEILKSL